MDFVLGRNTSYALSHNGNLLGFRKTYTLPPNTFRLEFTDNDFDPSQQSQGRATWTKVQGVSANQWDMTCNSSDWSNLLSGMRPGTYGNTFKVIDSGDTSGVTNMYCLFGDARLSETCWFDTRNVTNMFAMFELTWIRTVPKFNTSKVTTMREMFDRCSSLVSIPWMDTHNVTDMFAMLDETQIEEFPNMDTSKVTRFREMFRSCVHLKKLHLDTSSAVDINGICWDCAELTEANFTDTSKVTDMGKIFWDCLKLKRVPYMDVSSLENISFAFTYDYRIEGGALDLYNRAKDVIPAENTSAYIEAFRDCGAWTETGAVELAQIPEDWK